MDVGFRWSIWVRIWHRGLKSYSYDFRLALTVYLRLRLEQILIDLLIRGWYFDMILVSDVDDESHLTALVRLWIINFIVDQLNLLSIN